MNISDALQQLKDSIDAHGLTDWSGGLDNARRRFGVCQMRKKRITLSRHLCALNSEAEVRDTILHEIAHALAWERYGENCGHDQRWKNICKEIGARPVACFDDEVIQPHAPWVLVHRDTGEVFRTYHKRPGRDWSGVWIRGRKSETYGKLAIRANETTPQTADLFDRQEPPQHQPLQQLTAPVVTEFKESLVDQIRDLAAEYGLEVIGSKGSFSRSQCDITLSFGLPQSGDEADREKSEFESQAGVFGLSASHYKQNFTVNNRRFKLIGIKLSNRKYPIIGMDEDGRKYKFEPSALDSLLAAN